MASLQRTFTGKITYFLNFKGESTKKEATITGTFEVKDNELHWHIKVSYWTDRGVIKRRVDLPGVWQMKKQIREKGEALLRRHETKQITHLDIRI